MSAVLGVDIGTSGLTALVVDAASGQEIAAATGSYPLEAREGGVRRQHPDWWWDALVRAVRSFDGVVDVAAVAVAGQQHGLVCAAPDGSALGPAPLWNDTSAQAWADGLTVRAGGAEAVRRLIGMDIQPGFTAAHLARLRDVEPERFAAAARFCLPHDWITGRLCGTPVTDAGEASGTGYFDAATRAWSAEILALIDPSGSAAVRLPDVAPPGVALGPLLPEAAAALRLPKAIAVCNGTGDNMATAVAMGLFAPGRLGVSLGSSGTAFAYSASPARDPAGEVAAFCDATGGHLPLTCALNGTPVLAAVADALGLDLPGLEQAARVAPPGADGLAFLPYLDGERTPSLPAGSGAFVGLGRDNFTTPHIARAAYDAVVLAALAGVPALERAGVTAASVALAGGGAESPLLRQTVADVTGLPVRRVPSAEPAAWGAAALAAWAFTGEPVESVVRRWWHGAGPVSVTNPDVAANDVYRREIERRRALIAALPRLR